MPKKNQEELDTSIIIVSWNAKEFLRKCLLSIYETTFNLKFEVLVVDNNSTDDTSDMVAKEFPQVKLIQTGTNLGFARANNLGIKASIGRYVCLINSDVKVLKDCIELMVSYMDRHPSIGILGPRVLTPDLTLQPSCKGIPSLWNTLCRALALDTMFPRSKLFGGNLMRFWPHDTIRSVDVIVGCFWMVRREAFKKVGLLDEIFFMYGEDIDWCKRFRMAGWNVVFFPYAEIIHYGGASSSNAPIRFYIEMQRADMQYFKKHHSPHAQTGFLLILFLFQVNRIIGHLFISIILPSKKKKSIPKIKRSIACVRWLCNSSVLR